MKKAAAWLLCGALVGQTARAAELKVPAAISGLNVKAISLPSQIQQPALSLAVPAAPSAPAAPATQTSAAVTSLRQLGALLSPKNEGVSRQREALDLEFDAASRIAPQDDGVLAGGPGRDEPGLGPSRPHAHRRESADPWERPLSGPAEERRRPAWLQKLLDLPRQVTIGAGIAVLIASSIVGIHHHAAQKNKHWQASKSAVESQLIDTARKTQDAQTAARILEQAKARHERMAKRISDAQRQKRKKVDDATHDKVAQAKTYAAYDKLVSSRGELAFNELSKDPSKRVGEELPKTWRGELQSDESAAIAGNFDGFEALRLDKLNAELGREKDADARLSQGVEEFHQQVPMLFGGPMKKEYDKAVSELKRFEQDEIGAEQGLFDAKTAAMRGRVGDRLYTQVQQFHARRDRRDRLSALYEKKAAPALAVAKQVDSDLDGMISNRHTEAAMLALAAMHTADTETYETCNSNNECETHTRTVDNSGPYRAAAAVAASAAQSDAESAQQGMQKLRPMIAALHNDAAIQDENLVSALPQGANTAVDAGHGPLSDWFLPPLFGIFSSLSSADDGENARSAFSPVLSSLESVSHEVSSRRDGEAKWVEDQITSDLQQEEAKAKASSW